MNSVADVWNNVLQQLKGKLSETAINTWFDELEAVDIQGNTFILHCSNDFKKRYIESLYMAPIKESIRDRLARSQKKADELNARRREEQGLPSKRKQQNIER